MLSKTRIIQTENSVTYMIFSTEFSVFSGWKLSPKGQDLWVLLKIKSLPNSYRRNCIESYNTFASERFKYCK